MNEPWSQQAGVIAEQAYQAFREVLTSHKELIKKQLKKATKPPEISAERAFNEQDYPQEFVQWLKDEVFPQKNFDQMSADWNELLNEWLLGTIMTVGGIAYDENIATMDKLNLDFAIDKIGKFDFVDDQLLDWIKWRAETSAIEIVGTSADEVRKLIYDVIADGPYSMDKIAKALDDSFAFGNDRARTIARTETLSAQSTGQFANDAKFYNDGMLIGKTWYDSNDNRVRDWHHDANGQTVDFMQPFIVDGEALMFPRDSENGSAKNVIQCRCTYHVWFKGQEDKMDAARKAYATKI